MFVGDVATIIGVKAEKDAVITMVSSNESVANVSAAGDGSFTISARAEGMSAITITTTKESTDAVTYLPGIKKFLVLVDKKDTQRIQLTVSDFSAAALTKVYDATTNAYLQPGALGNVASGDDVKLGVKAFYADTKVGTGKTMYISFHLYGRNADKYISPRRPRRDQRGHHRPGRDGFRKSGAP